MVPTVGLPFSAPFRPQVCHLQDSWPAIKDIEDSREIKRGSRKMKWHQSQRRGTKSAEFSCSALFVSLRCRLTAFCAESGVLTFGRLNRRLETFGRGLCVVRLRARFGDLRSGLVRGQASYDVGRLSVDLCAANDRFARSVCGFSTTQRTEERKEESKPNLCALRSFAL